MTNNEKVIEIYNKYKPQVMEIITESKNGISNYEDFGHKCDLLLKQLMSISIKDFI